MPRARIRFSRVATATLPVLALFLAVSASAQERLRPARGERALVATTTTIDAPSSSICGSSVTLQASVTPASATGTVEFRDGMLAIGSGTLDGSGNAQAIVTFSSPGSHSLTARYLGDSGHDPSESSPLLHAVDPQATTTALSAPAELTCGDQLQLEAVVSPAREGTITFFDGATDLGAVTVDEAGLASFSILHGLAPGPHALTASFSSGDACTQASTSPAVDHQVNPAPTTLALAAPASLACGSPLTMTATVSPASAGTVTFFDGLDPIATSTVSSGVATASLPSGLPPGPHSLVASYSPTASCSGPSTSNNIAHSVERIPTTLALLVSPSSACGQNVTLTASLDPVFPGMIRFFAGPTQLGSAPVNGVGTASIVVAGGLPTGDHSLYATYTPGSVCAEASVSDSEAVVVQPASTSLVLVSNRNPSSTGDMVAITARITPASAQGTIELFDGATSLGTAPITQGAINFNPTFTAGDHSLTATFTDGDCWQASTSPVLVQHVVTPTLSISDASVVEGDEADHRGLLFAVTMDAPLMNQTVTLHVKSYDGTAHAGVDYTPIDQDMIIFNGQTSTTVFIPVFGDRRPEPSENLTVVLSNADLAMLGDSVATGTIVDDDVAVLLVPNVSRAEGNQGSSPFVFTATLSKRLDATVSFDWHTEDFGATIANGDYQADSGQVTFAPFDSVETFSVMVNGDSVFEENESLRIVLENVVNTIPVTSPLGIIQNDDGAPSIVIDDVVVTEGDAGHVDVAFPVRLVRHSFEAVSVSFETLDGTALANSDYLSTTGTLTIDPKTSEGFVVVKVFGDALCEQPDETFSVRIFGPHGGVIARNTATGTIADQDCIAGVGPVEGLPLLDLAPIQPNPARDAVRLRYALGRASRLRLDIVDVQGRVVATLADGALEPGRYEVAWTGAGERGPVATGLYFARCRAAGKTVARAFVYAR